MDKAPAFEQQDSRPGSSMICSPVQYAAALEALIPFLNRPPHKGQADYEYHALLTKNIMDWERLAYGDRLQTALSAIRFRMEQCNLAPRDLALAIGRQSRVYEVLNRKRNLTLPMVKRLHRYLCIQAESLIS